MMIPPITSWGLAFCRMWLCKLYKESGRPKMRPLSSLRPDVLLSPPRSTFGKGETRIAFLSSSVHRRLLLRFQALHQPRGPLSLAQRPIASLPTITDPCP